MPLDNRLLSRKERQHFTDRRERAERKAAVLTAKREGLVADLRGQRNAAWDMERAASQLALRLLRMGRDDDARWELIWSHALDDQWGDDTDRELSRLEALSPAELIAEQRLEVGAA